MRFVGLDVHKRVVEAAVIDEAGVLLFRYRFPCTREALSAFAGDRLSREDRVALEATTNTWAVVDVLAPLVGEVVVSNPLRTRAIAEAKVKTDKVDALVLAQLLRADYLPRVWTPDTQTRDLRSLTSRRASLVQDRTGVKNRIHSILHLRLIPVPEKFDLFGTKGRAFLAALDIDDLGRTALESELRLLDGIDTELAGLARLLDLRGYVDSRVRLLMTLPGVDVAVAQTLLAVFGDHSRFKDGDHAASYLGLVPSTHQSADNCYHGHITKHGKGHARWILVQAAQHLGSHPGPLGVFFRRLTRKKNRNVAVVATARKLVVIAWLMLKNGEPYRYALPRPTERKLSRLRVAATGRKKTGGLPKGSSRPPNYGSGVGSRTIPALPDVYAAEGLPPVPPLAPGELAAIKKARVVRYVLGLASTHRVPREASAKPPPPRANADPG
ncbi:MAG: IS110 family transposase [Anaeromyxobacteraceae bacterium]